MVEICNNESPPALPTGDNVTLVYSEAWGYMYRKVGMSLLIPTFQQNKMT